MAFSFVVQAGLELVMLVLELRPAPSHLVSVETFQVMVMVTLVWRFIVCKLAAMCPSVGIAIVQPYGGTLQGVNNVS